MISNVADLGDRRQRKSLYHRAAALATTFLAAATFRAHFFFPWAFPFYIITLWSFLDAALRLNRRYTHLIISVLLDLASTGFILFHALLMAIDWLLEGNGYSLLAALLLTAALYFHGRLCIVAAAQYLKRPRDSGKKKNRSTKLPI
ncbi:hypothetical protein N7492_009222 [Penicillium capsulatum]|uniref:Uncharacterized protein n=1 Tax=Penicillium capsulatum TaxID=69766 RepID=A0A9W9LHJ6_9EURO|nr:hypothetical protein N7492_009222 [Penicillium capsulatum]KAJ6106618.1 hypothetical protein N7512_010135 [Penicillium capsulatum]